MASAEGAALLACRPRGSQALADTPRHYPVDPLALANFRQKLFAPVAEGPFGVLDVVGPLALRASAASFTILPGRPSPFLPYQTELMMGWLGDSVLANLTPNASLAMTPRTYRLRLLNGSNARVCRLAFVNGRAGLNFTVIGTDGGLIERPESATEAFLSPGERLDVLLDAGQAKPGADIFLKSLAFDQTYVFHCHNLEHADGGITTNYRVQA